MFKIASIFAVILTLSLATAKWLGFAAIGTLTLTWFNVFLPVLLVIGLALAVVVGVFVFALVGIFFTRR